jgi:tetratricopeptide (TPR) repeat protein
MNEEKMHQQSIPCMDEEDATMRKIRDFSLSLGSELLDSQSPNFTEEADQYGFSWMPSIKSLLDDDHNGDGYISQLRSDPVFYNPASSNLMSSCYDIEPYFSCAYGALQCSWTYLSLKAQRNEKISYAMTIEGLDLCRANEDRKAIPILSRALEVCPSNIEAIIGLGACHANLGNLDVAVGQFQNALSLEPDHELAKIYLEAMLAKVASLQTSSVEKQDPHMTESISVRQSNNLSDDEKHHKKKKKSKKKKKKKKKSHNPSSDNDIDNNDRERKRRRKSRSARSSSPSSSSSSSTQLHDKSQDEEEEQHPILARNKHKLWDV